MLPKYPKETNVMKIFFSRKELSRKLKQNSQKVEMTTSVPETENSTEILLDRSPFKRTIDDKHFVANDATESPDFDYEVTGVLIYHPFDVTTAAGLDVRTTTAEQKRDEDVAMNENHSFEVTTAASSSVLSTSEILSSSASSETTNETQNKDETVGSVHDSASTEVQDVTVSSQNTGGVGDVAATSTTETIATTPLPEPTTPGSVSTTHSDKTLATSEIPQGADPDVAITEAISADAVTFSPSNPPATEAVRITSTAQALAEATTASREDELATPSDNISAIDSTSVSDVLLVSTEDTVDGSAVDPENIGAVQISTTQLNIESETTTEPLTAATTITTPILLQTVLPSSVPTTTSVQAATSNPTVGATTPRNAFSIFEGGRVFIFNQNLGKSAPSLRGQTSTDKPASKPFFKGIFKAVAKHPITKTLFSTRPANVNREQNMLSTIWKFNTPILEPKKIHKRHTEVLVTPSPRESVTARKSLIDRLREETSVERAERRHKTVEGLMHAATIAGHFDSFLTGRLKHGVKTLHKLFSTDEEIKTKR